MSKRITLAMGTILLLAGALAGGCDKKPLAGDQAPPPLSATPPPTGPAFDYDHDVTVQAKGPAVTVAILRFGDTTEVADQPFGQAQPGPNTVVIAPPPPRPGQTPPQMNKRAREALKNALVNNPAFAVVERERILEILREINFGKSPYVDPATAPEQGAVVACRYLIEGSLGRNEDPTLKGNIEGDPPDYRELGMPGALEDIYDPTRGGRRNLPRVLREIRERRLRNAARRTYRFACYLSAYEVHSGRVAATVMGLGANGTLAIDDAVGELATALAKKAGEVRIAAVGGPNKVYLDVGGLKTGSQYDVVALGEPIRDRNGAVIGHEENTVGRIEVTESREALSIAKALSGAGAIKRGQLARPAVAGSPLPEGPAADAAAPSSDPPPAQQDSAAPATQPEEQTDPPPVQTY